MKIFFGSLVVVLYIDLLKNMGNSESVKTFKDSDVDDFIAILLKSNSFDQIVKKIAEKTAEEINNIKYSYKSNLHATRRDGFELKNGAAFKPASNSSKKLMLKYKLFTQKLEKQDNRRRSRKKNT